MKKADLMKYAEQGVRDRLKEIQTELNALAKDFPHIVGNGDGAVPAVLPLAEKRAPKKNATLSATARRTWDNLTAKQKAERIKKMTAARKAKESK